MASPHTIMFHFLACLLIYLFSFNPIFRYDFKFFCSFVSYLTTCQLTICQLIDWLVKMWNLDYLMIARTVWSLLHIVRSRCLQCTRLELYYDFMYRIIILCLSYLAIWLSFLNKPIDWLIDWLINCGLSCSHWGVRSAWSPLHTPLNQADRPTLEGYHLAIVPTMCEVNMVSMVVCDVYGAVLMLGLVRGTLCRAHACRPVEISGHWTRHVWCYGVITVDLH